MTDSIFQYMSSLSDPVRIRLLHILKAQECSVGELKQILQLPQSTISRHLKVLNELSWLEKRKQGPSSWYRFNDDRLNSPNRELWDLLEKETAPIASEDLRRLLSVIALRKVDSITFFQKLGAEWSSLRQDLFGSSFLWSALLQLVSDKLVIADLGCGGGEALLAMAPAVKKVIGVDQSDEMLDICRSKTASLPEKNRIELRQGSIETLPIENNEVHAMLCVLVLHHIDDLGKSFREMARGLKPGGKLILIDMLDHDRKDFTRTMGHKHLGFSKTELCAHAHRAGLKNQLWRNLGKEAGALGPPLFIAVFLAPVT